MKAELHPFLTWALYGGEWSDLRPGRFTPGERDAGTHWIEGCMGPIDGLEMVAEEIPTCPCRQSNPGRPDCSLVTTDHKHTYKFSTK
jgi:hypothetical protein